MSGTASGGFEFKVTLAGEPVAGACVFLRFPSLRKNDFDMVAGPTDARGVLFVGLSEIEDAIRGAAATSPMDYSPGSWSRRVTASVMTTQDVERALKAADIWGEDSYRPRLLEAIRAWGEHLAAHPQIEVTGERVGNHDVRLTTR